MIGRIVGVLDSMLGDFIDRWLRPADYDWDDTECTCDLNGSRHSWFCPQFSPAAPARAGDGPAVSDQSPDPRPGHPNIGDVITIGPSCFAAADRSCITWGGELFVPQKAKK